MKKIVILSLMAMFFGCSEDNETQLSVSESNNQQISDITNAVAGELTDEQKLGNKTFLVIEDNFDRVAEYDVLTPKAKELLANVKKKEKEMPGLVKANAEVAEDSLIRLRDFNVSLNKLSSDFYATRKNDYIFGGCGMAPEMLSIVAGHEIKAKKENRKLNESEANSKKMYQDSIKDCNEWINDGMEYEITIVAKKAASGLPSFCAKPTGVETGVAPKNIEYYYCRSKEKDKIEKLIEEISSK